MKKTFNNFSDFVLDFDFEFTNTQNERLALFMNLIKTLNQGCGCTRRQRAEQAEREWLAIGTYLTEDNIGVIKNKYQGHVIEFCWNGPVFFTIE